MVTVGPRSECFHCSRPFNPLQAKWCSCLVGTPTLLCPNCDTCFCDQPQEFKRIFWNTAPKALLDRRNEEQQLDFKPNNNLFLDEIRRPLILIAEDTRLVLRLAHQLITKLGYGALAAADGEEALELAKRYKPDMVFSDALLPKLDGRELCNRIKSSSEMSATPVVIFTAVFTQPRHRTEAMSSFQADEYLLKPLKPEQVQEILLRYVGPPKQNAAAR